MGVSGASDALPHVQSLRAPLVIRQVLGPQLCRRQQRLALAAAATGSAAPLPHQPTEHPSRCCRRVVAVAAAAGTVGVVSAQRPGGARRGLAALAVAGAGAVAPLRPAAEGDEVLVRYRGRLEDGTVFDEIGEDAEPFGFRVGAGEVVPGFDAAVRGLVVGKRVTVTVPPGRGYGKRSDDLVVTLGATQVPDGLREGMQVTLGGGAQKVRATVAAIKSDGSAVLDANPPLAGKTLIFDIELVSFKEPPQRGLEMVGWHGERVQVPLAIANSRVSKVFNDPRFPPAWPYSDADFRRQDETDDVNFYDTPRLVTHIDEGAVGAIKDFYAVHFARAPQGEYSVLDICSSWISHYPEGLRAKRVAVTGMNEGELARNKQASEHVAKDLNKDPRLPFGDGQFDFVTNVVSVDYLSKPREIFTEIHRVMKPGGVAIMSFSNRCFPTKAIAMWVANMNDGPGHCQIVGNYFHFCPQGGWRDISSADISPMPGRSDPVWVVTAVKA